MVCTCVLFAVLCLISLSFRKVQLTKAETAFIQIPFSFYFGWIIFSIVANASVVMTKFSIASSGKTEEDWTMIMVAVLTIFTVLLKIFGRNPIFGIPVLWGLSGILYKHISMDGYGYQYPDLIMELMICVGILIIITAYYMFSGKAFSRKKRSIIEEMNSVMDEATAENIVNHTFKEYEVAEKLHKKKEQEEKEREIERKKNEKKQKREALINRFVKNRNDERRETEKESCEKVTEEHKI
jgi:ABC-type multidrug transport system fused ATPase/permease subunit